MTYASPCWFLKNVVSSYQVELLRKKERFFLRKCCNIFKNHENNKFINSKILYKESNLNRIDREIIKNNIKFVNKAKTHDKQIIRDIFSTSAENIENIKYKKIDYFNILENENRLHENDLLLIFNKKKYRPNDNVYVQAQNETDI